MGWSIAGVAGSVLVIAAALIRSRGAGGFYDDDVYGMTPRTHRRYAAIAALFAAGFGLFALVDRNGAVWLFAVFTVFAILYATSYLRGALEDDA